MITQIIIIALLVLSIHYTMQPDEIFGKFGDWLEDHLPDAVHPAVFDCNCCMCPWYGSLLYWLIPWQRMGMPLQDWAAWPIVVICAMGVNVVVNRLTPEKNELIKGIEMIPENVLRAYKNIKEPTILQTKDDWDVLFAYYNSNLTNGQIPLRTSCNPCYPKVLSFVGEKIKSLSGEKAETKEDVEAKKE